jgi:hypothetical protein
MRLRLPISCLLAALALAAAGCGTTEKSGNVGETLSAKGIEVTVAQIDQTVPVPRNDITGLSSPGPGQRLIGVRVHLCSNHGGAIGPYDFGLKTSSGDASLKFPSMNYANSFDSLRNGCGGGWVVFNAPVASKPEQVTFGFQDTGSSYDESNNVDAKFSWSV